MSSEDVCLFYDHFKPEEDKLEDFKCIDGEEQPMFIIHN